MFSTIRNSVPSPHSLVAVLALSCAVATQWDPNPAVNTSLAPSFNSSSTGHAMVRSGGGCLYAFIKGGSKQLAVQVLDSSGSAQLSTGSVVDAATVFELVAHSNGAGGMVIAYRRNSDAYALRIDSAGATIGSPIALCSLPSSTSSGLDITSDGAGGVCVVWREQPNSGPESIRVQRVEANGNLSWAANGAVVTAPANPARVWRAKIVSDGSSGAFVGWVREVSQGYSGNSMTRRILNSGSFAWSERPVTINAPATDNLRLEMASDGSGRALYAVTHWPSTGPRIVLTQRVDAAGSQEWPASSGVKTGIFTFSSTAGLIAIDDNSFDIESAGDGSAIVVVNRGSITAGPVHIVGQRVDGDLATPLLWGGQTTTTPAVISASHENYHPVLHVQAQKAIVAWTAFVNTKTGSSNIHAQRIRLSDGSRTWGTTTSDLEISTAIGDQSFPMIIRRSTCSWVIGFVDGRNQTLWTDGFCQVVSHHASNGAQLKAGPCFGMQVLAAEFASVVGFTTVGGNLILTAGGSFGDEPHLIGGTPLAPMLLADIRPGGQGSMPDEYARVGRYVYFSANDGTNGRELWRTDGTPAGTRMVTDLRRGSGSSTPRQLTACGDELYFVANDGQHGLELFRIGTSGSAPVLVSDINPGSASSYPAFITEFGGKILFTATSAITGSELYRTDGTPSGTQLVRDINVGAAASTPCCLTRVGDTVFFVAFQPATGFELYITDGSGSGTVLVKDIALGTLSSSARHLTAFDNSLYFVASRAGLGRELWKSDGTEAGTVLVKDIRPGASSSDPQGLVANHRCLLLTADDGVHGPELWSLSNSDPMPRLVRDIRIGATGGKVTGVAAIGSRFFYFAANDGTSGVELWRTDGKSAELFADLNAGPSDSNPRDLGLANGELVCFANTGLATDMLLIEPGATSQSYGCGCIAPGTSSRPSLTATDPVIGRGTVISGHDAPVGSIVVLLLGLKSENPFPLGNQCSVLLNLAFPPIGIYTAPVTASAWEFELPIMLEPRYAGMSLAVQSAYLTPGGVAFSDAVSLMVGY